MNKPSKISFYIHIHYFNFMCVIIYSLSDNHFFLPLQVKLWCLLWFNIMVGIAKDSIFLNLILVATKSLCKHSLPLIFSGDGSSIPFMNTEITTISSLCKTMYNCIVNLYLFNTFIFLDKFSLTSHGLPETHFADQVDLDLREICLSRILHHSSY